MASFRPRAAEPDLYEGDTAARAVCDHVGHDWEAPTHTSPHPLADCPTCGRVEVCQQCGAARTIKEDETNG